MIRGESSLSQNTPFFSKDGRFFCVLNGANGFLELYATKAYFQTELATPYWSNGVTSQGAPLRLHLSHDGNLRIIDNEDRIVWQTNTSNPANFKGPFQLEMQCDANLVLYDSTHRPYWASGTDNKQGTSTLYTLQVLEQDRVIPAMTVLFSYNGRFFVVLNKQTQSLELYETQIPYNPQNPQKYWDTGRREEPGLEDPFTFRIQGDANFVIYAQQDRKEKPIWASNTHQHPDTVGPYRMEIQDDGNLVLYDSRNRAYWASNTVRK